MVDAEAAMRVVDAAVAVVKQPDVATAGQRDQAATVDHGVEWLRVGEVPV